VTSVGENEEKANTIQPPLLVFFSPSHFANSQPGSKFPDFPKAVSSSLGYVVAIGGRLRSLLRNEDPL